MIKLVGTTAYGINGGKLPEGCDANCESCQYLKKCVNCKLVNECQTGEGFGQCFHPIKRTPLSEESIRAIFLPFLEDKGV